MYKKMDSLECAEILEEGDGISLSENVEEPSRVPKESTRTERVVR